MILQEDADGFRTLNDATRIWDDGRVEQLGWPRVEIDYLDGTRHPLAARIRGTSATGEEILIEIETGTQVVLHLGGGYGGDAGWTHGQWRGDGFTERVDYDLDDPEVVPRIPFGVIDHVATARCGGQVGRGLFEHGTFGRHDPSGFVDWSNARR